MEKFVLGNGLTVICDRRPTDSVAVEVSVRAGSNNERKGVEGVSHFLEHMLFEGTKKRRSSSIIANEIERLGGELNAATSNDRTFFYAKLPAKHFEVALDVLSDIIQNPAFPLRGLENNRKVIINEINMVNDEPLFYQWILLHRELFKGTPVSKPVYGNVEAIKSLSRETLLEYYHRHYTPENMVLSIVGGVGGEDSGKVEGYFTLENSGKSSNAIKVPRGNTSLKVVEKKKMSQSYLVLGYRTVPRIHEDSYVLDVIDAVLGRGQSGWMFNEIRNKRALAYNVGVEHNPELDYGMFAVNAGTEKKNVDKVVRIMLANFRRLEKLSQKQLDEARTYVEGNRILDWEENLHRADSLCFYEHAGDYGAVDSYLRRINAVTLEDVERVSREYLGSDYTLAVLEQEI